MKQKLQTLFNKTADSLFTKKDLESLYECEYKLFELSKRDYLGDSALSLQGKLLNRLRFLISKGITALKSALEFWLNRHEEIAGNMLKSLEHTADIYMEEEKYSEMGREAVLDMLKQKALLYKDKDPVFINISKLYDEIKDFPTGNLNEDRAAFQKALIMSHKHGKMLDYIPKSENYRDYITKSLLDELSSGEKYIDRWNTELLKVSKVTSDKPAYKKKEKTDSGYKWVYDEKHIEKRWKEKREKIERLEKNIKKVRKQYEKDLTDDDLRTRAIAAVVGIIDDTAMRVGNPESVEEHETYGATTLKVKHLNFVGSKVNFKFSGKDEVLQDDTVKNAKVIKVLKELIKKKKNDDFIFEVDGKRIWDRAINRYLEPFEISAKDLRGFHSNRLMKEMLKKKDWEDALEEVADFIGHKPSTLKNQYLDPELVEKHEKKSKASEVVRYISKRAILLPDDQSVIEDMRQKYLGVAPKKSVQDISQRSKTIAPTDIQQQQKARLQIRPKVKLTPTILNAWLTLLPFLPKGAVMTSGFRTPEDQVRILNNYWRQSTGENIPPGSDYAEISRILKREYGLIVGPPWTKNPYAHLKGNAFDVAGADLYEIAKAVKFVSSQPKLNTKLSALIENVNNAVHINIISAQYDARAVSSVMQEISGGYERIASIKESEHFRAEMPRKISTRSLTSAEQSEIDKQEIRNNGRELAEEDPYFFLKSEWNIAYPEFEPIAAESLIKKENRDTIDRFFVELCLHKKYPDIGRPAVQNLAKQDPLSVLGIIDVHDVYPDLVTIAIETLISQKDINIFNYLFLNKRFVETLCSKNPGLAELFAKYLVDLSMVSFFDKGYHKIWPDVGKKAAINMAQKDWSRFVYLKIDKYYPEVREILAKIQRQYDEQYLDSDERPLEAKHKAQILYSKGSRTFIHTGAFQSLKNIKDVLGEICVSSWDLSNKAFSQNPITLAAIFEGRASHYFEEDVWSSVGPLGLRRIEKPPLKDAPPKKEHDEAWFNPNTPGNKLVGFAVIGSPDAGFSESKPGYVDLRPKDYSEYFKQAKELAELNNVSFIQLGGSPWELEQMRQPLERVPEELKQQEHEEWPEEDMAKDKDEANKYEKEKSDPKWDEVLIDDERKWTRKEIRNHYVQNADKILKNIKGKPVMLYIGTEKNKNILKRHHNDKPIIINNKEDLEWWADRRLVGLHYIMGNKTKFGWIDLDLHDYPIEKAQSYAKKLVPMIKKELGATPEIWESGGTGLHIEFDLSKEWDIDDLREKLKVLLGEFNKDYPEVSTGVIKGKGMRSDISTLHKDGNLRVGHSLGESVGNIKKPLGKNASISVIHKWFADMSQKYG